MTDEEIVAAWERALNTAARQVSRPRRLIPRPHDPETIRTAAAVAGWRVVGFILDAEAPTQWRAEWQPETNQGRLVAVPTTQNAYTPALGAAMTLEQAHAFVARYADELQALGERTAAVLAKAYQLPDLAPHIYSAEEHVRNRSGRQTGREVVLAGQVSYQRSSSRPYASALLLVTWETEEVFAEAPDEQPVRRWGARTT